VKNISNRRYKEKWNTYFMTKMIIEIKKREEILQNCFHMWTFPNLLVCD
jgi:hypothetical protein